MTQPLTSASQIQDAVDLAEEIVTVPEWNLTILLQQMDAAETTKFTEVMEAANKNDGMFIILIFSARHPETRQLIFTIEDLPMLRKKNFNIINRLQKICLKLHRMGREAEAELKKA